MAEEQKKLIYNGQDHCKVHAGEDYRDKEDRQHLGVNALFYVLLGHADLLHNAESCLIFKAFGYLLVVDNENAGHEEDHA